MVHNVFLRCLHPVTEDMVRRRAEHNEGQIFSLEELSLHQQDIERIEHIDRWCRELRILYLQNNLIPRMENLGRLKKLEYLNLALNNIEVIENLEGCESLQKLDLTVNFVGRLSSLESLKHNVHLRELFLVGNPCTQFQGYRQYVVASLPQLQRLDGTDISRSERIRSVQGLDEVRRQVLRQEREYEQRRAAEKEEAQRSAAGQEEGPADRRPGSDGRRYTNTNTTASPHQQEEELEESTRSQESAEEQRETEFWHAPCLFTPESRVEAYRHLEDRRRGKAEETEKKPKAPRTLITTDGRVLNVNEPKLDFCLTEDEENNSVVLDLSVYRHMDTSLMDVDVQPTYARVSVKGKIFQVVLPAEVKPDSSTAQRSQTTGHLVLTMPRAEGELIVRKTTPGSSSPRPPLNTLRSSSPEDSRRKAGVPERLEVDPSKRTAVDLAGIVWRQRASENPPEAAAPLSEGFQDHPDEDPTPSPPRPPVTATVCPGVILAGDHSSLLTAQVFHQPSCISLTHLETKNSHVRMLFIDFSTAFNTIIPQQLIYKLDQLGLNTTLCSWLLDFLTGRPQAVQGCVLSPLLFTLLTHDCTPTSSSNLFIKFADDTTVVGLINSDETIYRSEVSRLATWCQDNSLHLNVEKTKEIVVDLRREHSQHAPLTINGAAVERTEKSESPAPIRTTCYRGTVESVLTSCIAVWYGACTVSC
ncbi:dynein axonemal assembly factor 11 [Salarias fasciatus]|uniref:dynein axonemal assembly factor 11 n=1 Tax=Salarias fasciatus TaxID=181472 RepID=UPI0011766C7D|nr:protein tilB homolog [Salarias fasciatus]